jgi:hypothetical protein
VSVRAAQLAKLLEMLKLENFPTPTVPVAAAAAGISDRSLRDAGRLRRKAPELADQVAKGNISGHAARQLADLPPGEEREAVIKKVAAAGNKKKAKGIVRETKRRKKQQQQQLGSLKMPGLTGAYSTLLAVLENIPRLANELRNLMNDRNPLSVKHARELRTSIEALKRLDTEELLAAADVAALALDRIIAKGTTTVEQMLPNKRSEVSQGRCDD